ncbi:DNA-binding protein [Pseudomonas fluorescens ABAC62]|nr:DNA-binding protein [Pseudomonas fluorescens ABAC62]
MSYTPELVAELEILALFNLDSSQEGLKVHQTAAPTAIAAAKRMFEKDLITQPDGGYLTSLGRDAAQYTQSLLTILTTQKKEAA